MQSNEAQAPVAKTATAKKATAEKSEAPVHTSDEPVVVIPYDMGPEGEMTMSWEPTEAPERPKPKARKMDAKPSFVSGKANKRRLFVLPTKFEH